MRTTVRIDDQLMRELKQLAQSENVSVTKPINRVLRRGLQAAEVPSKRRRYRQKVYAMGQPFVNLDKGLSLAAALEDAAIIDKLAVRK